MSSRSINGEPDAPYLECWGGCASGLGKHTTELELAPEGYLYRYRNTDGTVMDSPKPRPIYPLETENSMDRLVGMSNFKKELIRFTSNDGELYSNTEGAYTSPNLASPLFPIHIDNLTDTYNFVVDFDSKTIGLVANISKLAGLADITRKLTGYATLLELYIQHINYNKVNNTTNIPYVSDSPFSASFIRLNVDMLRQVNEHTSLYEEYDNSSTASFAVSANDESVGKLFCFDDEITITEK